MDIEPYLIDLDPRRVQEMMRRVGEMRWPEIPFETGWSAGTADAALRDLADYWQNGFDWFAMQERLNTLEHLRGPIRGEQLHCVRFRSVTPSSHPPLLLIHGWPSSFLEFWNAAERLSRGDAGNRPYDVIVPSLPGFVLSDAPASPGVAYDEIAQRLHLLMGELGYERYGVHGGDWGSLIGTQIARRYPESVAGLHLNFVASAPPPPDGTDPAPGEEAYREARSNFDRDETGYSAIQGTRPQTLSYAQADSPVGLLAWILEKYWAWGDHGGDLWSVFDRDILLSTAMLYWVPNRILSAARIYYETRRQSGVPSGRVTVPTSYAEFPREPWGPPPEVVARTYNLVRHTTFPRGGHFPALEQPEAWSSDIASFFDAL